MPPRQNNEYTSKREEEFYQRHVYGDLEAHDAFLKLLARLIFVLGLAFLILYAFAQPVEAQQVQRPDMFNGEYTSFTVPDLPEIFFEEPPEDAASNVIGLVKYTNQVTFNSEVHEIITLETPSNGTIYFSIDRTPNADCSPGCPDTIMVYNIPDGIIAIPSTLTEEEGDTGYITLYKYEGS